MVLAADGRVPLKGGGCAAVFVGALLFMGAMEGMLAVVGAMLTCSRAMLLVFEGETLVHGRNTSIYGGNECNTSVYGGIGSNSSVYGGKADVKGGCSAGGAPAGAGAKRGRGSIRARGEIKCNQPQLHYCLYRECGYLHLIWGPQCDVGD
eukprot:1876643-Rhodomonas_salina.1